MSSAALAYRICTWSKCLYLLSCATQSVQDLEPQLVSAVHFYVESQPETPFNFCYVSGTEYLTRTNVGQGLIFFFSSGVDYITKGGQHVSVVGGERAEK